MTLKQKLLQGLLCSVIAVSAQASVQVQFSHFFGDESGKWGKNTDLSKIRGEREGVVIQTLINKYNAENSHGYKVVYKAIPGATYYDALKANYAVGDLPDIALMHGDAIPGYARRHLLQEMGPAFAKAGIGTNDFTEQSRAAIEFNGKQYGLPYDQHGLLWHMNVELFEKAGLVDDKGQPLQPSSPEEWLKHARIMKEKTGQDYLALDMEFPFASHATWVWFNLIKQQGGEFLSADGRTPKFNTAEGREALNLILRLIEEEAVNPIGFGEQDFLKGHAAVFVQGTWNVDAYFRMAQSDEFALKQSKYMVTEFPTIYDQPANFLRNHTWVMPRQRNQSEEVVKAAADFLGFLNEHNFAWGNTGHLPVVKSSFESDEYSSLPQRTNYMAAADKAFTTPSVLNYEAFQATLSEEIYATWMVDKPVEEALKKAEQRTARVMNR